MEISTEIKHYFSNKLFVEKTIEQIQKDTQNFIELPFFQPSKENVYASCILWITQIIQTIIENNNSHFFQWLYRVDINENKIKKILEYQSSNQHEAIAQLVLEREAQKVFFRLKFSENQNQNK